LAFYLLCQSVDRTALRITDHVPVLLQRSFRSPMPYRCEPHLHYQALQIIREVWQMAPDPSLASSAEFVRQKLRGLSKTRGYIREFFWKNYRYVRLAIEECPTLSISSDEWPFRITSVFLRLQSQVKSPAERVLADREEIRK